MGTVKGWAYVALLSSLPVICVGVYFITDYYMDDGWPSAFGQVCGKNIEDDCLYVNSHLNSLGILNYGDDITCTVQLNAGNRRGARYKLKFKRFDLEGSENCNDDFLTIYDTKMANRSFTAPIGKFCGNTEPNITGYPTQQYLSLQFKTDGSTGKKGYRIMATRTLPYPCYGDSFHCKAENRCIDGRLQCDGTVQCDDGTDEDGCSFWEKLLGGFLALGLSSIVGIVFLVVTLCTGICVTICVCTCCKKQCRCCKRCWEAICKPCMSGVKKVKTKIASVKENSKADVGVASKNDKVEIDDETADKPSSDTTDVMPTKTPVPGRVSDAHDCPPSKTPKPTEVLLHSDGNMYSSPGKGTYSDGNVVKAGVASTLSVAENGVTKVD